MTVEQKAKRFCKDFVFTYTIPSYNETKRKSGALIAEESFIAGYNECQKEHEWHKVLYGDLPKHDHEVLCLLWGGIREIGYYKNEVWYFEDFTADKEDVDYWQEIIPPKEIE